MHGLPYPKHDSTILLEQIRTIDKHRLQKYLGKITPAIQKKVDKALTASIGIRVS
ncbi:type II toxin-antitoxin system PemK/MazF family toxin [Blautia hominis]|uniref:type II toxin-antitoxin system PemK/MazF family toxin n=1 Tax=Blautia hominis TaxID=2025493 RepID=UPI0036F21516